MNRRIKAHFWTLMLLSWAMLHAPLQAQEAPLSASNAAPSISAAQLEPQEIPELTAPIIDTAEILRPEEVERLQMQLAQLEQKLGSQVVVWLLQSTAPEDIASLANRAANVWKIGRRELGDGILIVIASQDRKIRIEVAQTLEGAIPDVVAQRIISQQLAPALGQGQYALGIAAALDQIEARIAAEQLPKPKASDSAAQEDGFQPLLRGFQSLDLVIFLFFAVPIGGAVAKGFLGHKLGSIFTGGVVGGIAVFATASVFLGVIAGLVGLLFTLRSSVGQTVSVRRGVRFRAQRDDGGYSVSWGGGSSYGSSSGSSYGSSSGSDGWGSGGGGDFGGGGASGDFGGGGDSGGGDGGGGGGD